MKPIGLISSGVEASGVEASSPPQLARRSANAQSLISLIMVTSVSCYSDENTQITAILVKKFSDCLQKKFHFDT